MYVQTFNASISGVRDLFLRVYHNSSSPRDYPFSVTFIPNSAPTFSSPTINDLIVNWLNEVSFSTPSVSDAEGDSLQFEVVPPAGTSFQYQFFDASNVLRIYDISCSEYGYHTGFSLR